MANPFLDGRIDKGLYFVNAPDCQTRREATAEWLRRNHQAGPKPFNDVVPEKILHQIYHPWADDQITNRLIFLGPDGKVCKAVRIGKSNLMAEMNMLKLIKANTTVPVPRPYGYDTTQGFETLSLEKLEGDTLENVWSELSNEERERIADEVFSYVQELRKLTSVSIQASQLFDREPLASGLDTTTSFNLERFKVFKDERVAGYIKTRTAHLSDQPFVLTHGDLDWSNILVKEKTVCGLIDFEMSGFLPRYWELLLVKRMRPYSPWFALLEQRMQRLREPGWDKMWELEELFEAVSTYMSPSLHPESREEDQARGWREITRILGDDGRLPPKFEYPEKWRGNPWWLERL